MSQLSRASGLPSSQTESRSPLVENPMSDLWDIGDGPTIEELIEVQCRGVPDCYRIQTLVRMGVIRRSKLFELIRTQLKAKKLDSSTESCCAPNGCGIFRACLTLMCISAKRQNALRPARRRANVQARAERSAARPDNQSHERRSAPRRRT